MNYHPETRDALSETRYGCSPSSLLPRTGPMLNEHPQRSGAIKKPFTCGDVAWLPPRASRLNNPGMGARGATPPSCRHPALPCPPFRVLEEVSGSTRMGADPLKGSAPIGVRDRPQYPAITPHGAALRPRHGQPHALGAPLMAQTEGIDRARPSHGAERK